jgi:hypothetical protein
MKRIAPLLVLFLFAVLAWKLSGFSDGFSINLDGDEVDGPFGVLLGAVFAGGGLLIGAAVTVAVGAMLVLLFASLGVLLACVMAFVVLAVALAMSPLLLPLLIPIGIIWLLARRNRNRNRAGAL